LQLRELAVPSSISSSDTTIDAAVGGYVRGAADGAPPDPVVPQDRYARQTAADRPGVAQPVPLRPVPQQPWGAMLLGALALAAVLLGGWEWHWRAYGVHPNLNNDFGLWAIERRRIDAGEGDATVLLGSSRLYFDIQLPVWARLAGRAPIQLSFEGTSPVTALEDLAADPKFTGRLLLGIAPQVFFQAINANAEAAKFTHKESPSQFVSQWLSMYLIEPYFAFDDSDFALDTVLARQPWPQRPGRKWYIAIRKLADTHAQRNTHLWDKVEIDPQYRELARTIWRQGFQPRPGGPGPEEVRKTEQEQIARTAKAIATLRARGVQVLLIRPPSSGEFLAYENRVFPRQRTWDVLLKASGAPGIYFEDYPELQGYYLPEWSHMTRSEAERFTATLYRLIMRDFWGPGAAPAAAASEIAPAVPAR
jgi:hypothetical protein